MYIIYIYVLNKEKVEAVYVFRGITLTLQPYLCVYFFKELKRTERKKKDDCLFYYYKNISRCWLFSLSPQVGYVIVKLKKGRNWNS